MLTYDFRLPPGPRTVEFALLADLGFRAVWVSRGSRLRPRHMGHSRPHHRKDEPHQIWPLRTIPSYRHPMAQASAIATLEQIAPGRPMVGFGTGFTGRAGMGKKPLSLARPDVRLR